MTYFATHSRKIKLRSAMENALSFWNFLDFSVLRNVK